MKELNEKTCRELTAEEMLMVSGGQILNPLGVDHVNDPPPPPDPRHTLPGMIH